MLGTVEKMWNLNSGKKSPGESDLKVIEKEVVLEVERRDPRIWENKYEPG